ncbi:uncharacterized protein LOC129583948 [Paramacrobiotus metropolitanus]|uniref:uncharacterized protein LOC129583948 n=1 Tax=Paramacrobiotus metropolitanus TaxID=2943436 RepID=UPI002445D6BC|nr:uncharacterized protein LOC129583948 [Paramacrobiotus metropolitanus]
MTKDQETIIPVIDFAQYDIPGQRETVSSEICQALRTVGFLYLKNHGVLDQKIRNAFTTSKAFFELTEERKMDFATRSKRQTNITTYNPIDSERLNPSAKKEIREAFDLIPHNTVDVPEYPDFMPALVSLSQSYRFLAKKILHCIGIGLGLEDPEYFLTVHRNLDDTHVPSGSLFRTLYYPSFQREYANDPNVVRCGTHTDYGTVTLVGQDQVGGLEVQTAGGDFIPATPIPDTIVVNIGDLLQRWTSDELKATPHRVLCNTSTLTRQSLVLFVHPDSETVVEALGERPKVYPPIKAKDHLQYRYEISFG